MWSPGAKVDLDHTSIMAYEIKTLSQAERGVVTPLRLSIGGSDV
jgi:hypothetical protein